MIDDLFMKNKFLILSVITILFISCTKDNENKEGSSIIKVEDVVVQQANSKNIAKYYVGQVEENYSASLSFQTGGHVKDVFVGVGDKVKKGDILAVLDKENSVNSHKAAVASLKQAKDAYRRLKKVYDNGSLAEVKWVEMQTKLEQARSMEASTRKMLEDCELKAPFDGIIGSRDVEIGMNMLPSQVAFNLMDISMVKIRIPVPENEIASVKLGQDAEVEIAALGDTVFVAKVMERGVEADKLSRSYPVKVSIPNDSMVVMPGMVCKVYLEDLNLQKGFSVPAQAVQTGKDGHYVWLNHNGIAVRCPVIIGGFNENGVWVKKGLNEEDRVIISGFLKISDGSKVESVVK